MNSNLVYRGPVPEVADLPCQRLSAGHVYAVFELTDEDRAAIAAGANIMLGIHHEPIPPVSLDTTTEAVWPDDPEHTRCRVCRAFYVQERAAELDYVCGQCGGKLE